MRALPQIRAPLPCTVKLFGTDYDTRDGTCIRDYVHVMDLADAHLSALDKLMGGEGEIIANLGTGHGASVLEVLQAVKKLTGLEPPYEVCPRRDGDAPVLSADLIPTPIDQNRCAQSRIPSVMMRQGWSSSFAQASQQ